MDARSAVPGAAVELSGPGLAGKRTKVTVGGRRAKVLSGNRRKVRIVVPKLKPGKKKVVAKRRGMPASVGWLRVMTPFDGSIKVVPDRRRARRAVIGPGGGSLVAKGADGEAYALQIPAGAVAAATEITLTPAAKVTGLPLTGGRPVAVTFAPEHLQLAVPGTLRITYTERAPADSVGYTFDGVTGTAFELVGAGRSGRTLSVPIEHFSGAGAAATSPADFVAVISPLLAQTTPWTEQQANQVLETIDLFTRTFGRTFCASQPVCPPVRQRAEETLANYDISVDIRESTDPVRPGEPVDYSFVVQNHGPATARSVVVEWSYAVQPAGACPEIQFGLPRRTTFLATLPPGGTQTAWNISDTIVCNQNAEVTATADVRAAPPERDLASSNNHDSETTSVLRPYDLRVVITEPADPAAVGGELAYEIDVFNVGPATARAVALDAVATSEPIDACSVGGGGGASDLLGDIPSGGSQGRIVRITCTEPATLQINASASADPPSGELDPSDNSVAEVTTVGVGGVVVELRADYAGHLGGGSVNDEHFSDQPLLGQREAAFSGGGASVNHTTDVDDGGGQLTVSAIGSPHASASDGSGNVGGTSHLELSFTVSGAPVRIACTGSMSHDGIENDANQSGAALIIDGGVIYDSDAAVDYEAVLAPGGHTLETYAFAEATTAGRTFDASISVVCATG